MASQSQLSGRERRKDERIDVEVDATIRAYRMAPLSAALLDISSGGALLRADLAHFMIGDEVLLAAGKVEAVATIAWAREAFFGVSFHRRLADWQIEDVRRTGHA